MKDKKVVVVGLGRSGIAAVRYCVDNGASVVATDSKGADELGDTIATLASSGVEFELGGNDAALADGCDMLVMSPGVPLELPIVSRAREIGVPVIGEMELAVREIDRPIIAVTGTNGKTTTTALIGHILNGAGVTACVAGNIGTPIVSEVERARRSEYVVLEVSSFQMDTTPSLNSEIAIWLNATEDHIDRHGSFEAYVASKAKLFRQMNPGGVGIYNTRDDAVAKAVIPSRARLVPFDAEGGMLGNVNPSEGAWCGGGDLIVRTREGGMHTYPLSDTKLVGSHNRENMLAAILACELAGVNEDAIRSGLAGFKGLPHRMEHVREIGSVAYYNDSKGTNVGATVKALEGFERPVVLIAGGLAKGADLSPLVPAVKGKVRRAILIGEASVKMERLFSEVTETQRAGSMEEAVGMAHASAEVGDAVLLSPACASFDMFKDYADRGNAFKEAVNKLVTSN